MPVYSHILSCIAVYSMYCHVNPCVPHSINYEETGTSEGFWDRLGRRKMTNMSFFDVFKAPSFALVNSASQSNATGFKNVENIMFVIVRLPKRSHNPSLAPVSS